MEIVKFDVSKCQSVLKKFAEKLRECDEVKAAEAVESVAKALPIYIVK